MAKGFKTMHPLMVEGLKKCGIAEGNISQTWGNAKASAGFHAPEGTIEGHKYSSCVDLRWHLAADGGTALKSHLIEASFCPFYRDWGGNQHIHLVYVGARDDKGVNRILPGPKTQIEDFTQGRNGLSGHGRLAGRFAPSADERQQILTQYEAWAPHRSVKVVGPNGRVIRCYAFIESESGRARAELRPLMEGLGCVVSWEDGVVNVTRDGKRVETTAADLRLEGGQFTRGGVRALAEAANFTVALADGQITVS